MNPVPKGPARRHVWRWVLLGVGLCLTPFVCLAFVAASFLSLGRDATLLRRHVMDASDAQWSTRVQLSLGGLTLGALRQGLSFVRTKDTDDARLILGTVHRASVGVYERASGHTTASRGPLFAEADRAMGKRGWVRMVGMADHEGTVLIYVPEETNDPGSVELCLAVVNRKEMVVVSTSVDADRLAELVARHAGDRMHFAKFRL